MLIVWSVQHFRCWRQQSNHASAASDWAAFWADGLALVCFWPKASTKTSLLLFGSRWWPLRQQPPRSPQERTPSPALWCAPAISHRVIIKASAVVGRPQQQREWVVDHRLIVVTEQIFSTKQTGRTMKWGSRWRVVGLPLNDKQDRSVAWRTDMVFLRDEAFSWSTIIA